MGLYTNPEEGQWRDQALSYLRRELGASAPAGLEGPLLVAASPLEGDGRVAIYAFRAELGGRGEESYFVAAGETEPNYYPDYRLDVEDVLNLHVGTRFMLVVGVGQAESGDRVGIDATAAARQVVVAVAPAEMVEGASAVAMFEVEGARHVVVRCRVGGEAVYVMAGDAPPGFSRRVDLPPQVAYRVHLGRVMGQEKDE